MKWQYEIIQTKYYENDLLDKFKSLGRQGWELISVQANGLAFFKRADKKGNQEDYERLWREAVEEVWDEIRSR